MHRVAPKIRVSRLLRAALCGLVLAMGVTYVQAGAAPEGSEFDWGPLASRLHDVNGDQRLRAAGPIFERSFSPSGDRLSAVRPFYVRMQDQEAERTNYEFVWPLCVAKSFQKQFSWRFLTAMYWDWDREDPGSRSRFWILPVWFSGRDANGETYKALFPVAGQVNEFLRLDYINFLLFPIWSRYSVNGVETRGVLWPIISHTSGKGIHRFRVFPIYGKSSHRDRFVKRFILWPVWNYAEYSHPTSHGKGYILFPLWGRIRLNDESTYFLVPPLFRVSKGERLNTVHCPWPLYQYRSGEEERLYFWPVWGKRTLHSSHKTFLFWPIGHRHRIDQGDTILHRLYALPFVYSEVERAGEPDASGEFSVPARYFKLWPLFSYRREGEMSRWRALELWPRKQTGPIDRGYAPFWTLYTRTANGPDLDSEILWGLYRHRRRTASTYTSLFPLVDWSRGERGGFHLLKGLLGYEREGDAKSWQFLYVLRFGNAPPGTIDAVAVPESGAGTR